MRIAALALGLVIVAGACASKGTAAGDQTATARASTPRTNVITSQEISDSKAATIPDLIRQLRPGWPREFMVYVGSNPDPTALSRSPSTIREIRYLSRSEAQARWGSSVQAVVLITPR